MQDGPNSGANSRRPPFRWATQTDTMGTWLSSMTVTFPSILSILWSVTKSFAMVFLQPLAQWLEELEMVSQQVSASVTDVTLARDQKAEVFCMLRVQNTPCFFLSCLNSCYVYKCSADSETAFTQRSAEKAGVRRFLLPPRTTRGWSERAGFPR